MNEDMDIRDLPDDVRKAAGWDLVMLGACYIIRNADGSYERVPVHDIAITRRPPP